MSTNLVFKTKESEACQACQKTLTANIHSNNNQRTSSTAGHTLATTLFVGYRCRRSALLGIVMVCSDISCSPHRKRRSQTTPDQQQTRTHSIHYNFSTHSHRKWRLFAGPRFCFPCPPSPSPPEPDRCSARPFFSKSLRSSPPSRRRFRSHRLPESHLQKAKHRPIKQRQGRKN